MEAILGVDREVNNVLDKLAKFSSHEGNQVDHAVRQLREARQELAQGRPQDKGAGWGIHPKKAYFRVWALFTHSYLRGLSSFQSSSGLT